VVELHIRGVGGATAEDILKGPVEQVSGDAVAGFYRPRNGAPDIEAYDWGRLTSGTASRAIWWLLLPFTLFNVSGWMVRPRQGETEEPVRPWSSLAVGRGLVIAGSYLMTGMYVTWIAVVATDLVALDCGNVGDCRNRWYLAPLRWNEAGFQSRLLVGLIAAWAVTWLLLWFVKGSQDETEGYEPEEIEIPRRPDHGVMTRNDGLGDPAFWFKWEEHRTAFLRHIGVALFTLAGIGAYGWRRLPSDAGLGGLWWLVLILVVAVVGGIWLLDAPARFRLRDDHSGYDDDREARIVWLGKHLLVAVAGFVVGLLAEIALDPGPAERLGLTNGLRWLIVGPLLVALSIVGVLVYRRWRREPGGRLVTFEGFRFLGAGIAAGFGVYVLSAGFSSLTHTLGRFLLGNERVSTLGYNETIVELFGLGLFLIAAVTGGGLVIRRKEPTLRAVWDDYWGDDLPASDRARSWAKKVEGRRRIALLPREGDVRLTILVLGILTLQLVQAGQAFFDAETAWQFWEWDTKWFLTPLFGQEWLEWTHAAAAGVIVLFVFPGLQIMRLAFRNVKDRKQFGKAWDVMSFWPRRFHPLAAPCYAERAVPEFVQRIEYHRNAGRRVSIVSHSQGTVIAAAALHQIASADDDRAQRGEAPVLAGVAVTTYGSPLQRLYRNFFPTYFGVGATYDTLRPRLFHIDGRSGWRNFWRPTDYIGQRAFPPGDESDVRVLEAREPQFPVNSHTAYETEPQLIDWLEEVRTAMSSE
jgi:hypothetical protein